MARVDRTDSAIGVVRADLAADLPEDLYDELVVTSLDAQGRAVVGGAGQSGIVGVMIPNRLARKAGQRVDIFKLGEIVELEGLAAGTRYFAPPAADAALTTDTDDGAGVAYTYIGYTVEADRLVLSGF